MNQDVARMNHGPAALSARVGLLAFVVLGVSVPGTAEGANVTSWGWRASLAESGIGHVKAQSVNASATTVTPTTTLTQAAPEDVPEPGATTRILANQTAAWALAPGRYTLNHPVLGPLLAEEQLLKMGNTSNASTFNGLLPDNPFYNFYRWKRSLDPVRFDANHPHVGALLAQDQRVRNLIAASMVSATSTNQAQLLVAPAGAAPALSTSGGGGIMALQIQSVPEPTSLALLLLGSGALLAPRLARRLRAQRERDARS
jgi:hypothetical protein